MSGADMWSVEETTTSKRRARADRDDRISVRVIAEDRVSRHELPRHGEVCLGRGADAHITVPLLDVSRRHAMMRIEGDTVEVCDLGSANGTELCGRVLDEGDWQPMRSGDWFTLGDATVVMVAEPMRSTPARSVGREDYFEALTAQIDRHRRTGHAFAVLTLRCVTTRNWVDVVEAMLTRHEHLGVLGEALVSLILPNHDGEAAQALAEAIDAHLQRIGAHANATLKICPRDGQRPDDLVPKLRPERRTRAATARPPGPVVESPAMEELYALIREVAPSMTTVLLLGETGVGKEVLAKFVHQHSPRRAKAFLAINCAALSENLLESELFGYERGAFTGAVAAKAGLLETAEGGTVFLDELGEMPLSTQAKLLRVLEERKVWRLGSLKPLVIDVRIVAATNRDLQKRIDAGQFRADLFYRINGLSITIPPLRERREEVAPLTRTFARRAAEGLGRTAPEWSLEALECLQRYAWPGNIRELRNAVERAVLLSREGPVAPRHLPDEVRDAIAADAEDDETAALAPSRPTMATIDAMPPPPPLTQQSTEEPLSSSVPPAAEARRDSAGDLQREMERLERARIVEALEACQGNQTRAAERLGITRRMLISRLERYDIPRPRAGRRKKKD
ncbi:MAG: sigma 54-interacting transcriptional regulator [Myxococcota bacterium]